MGGIWKTRVMIVYELVFVTFLNDSRDKLPSYQQTIYNIYFTNNTLQYNNSKEMI